MGYQVHLVKQFEYLCHCRARKRVAAVGSSMVSGHQRLRRCLLIQDKCADRDSASKSLRKRHDIRFHSVCVAGEPGTRAAHSALDLIQDQENVLLITQLSHCLEELRVRGVDPALALHSLHEDRTGLVGHSSPDALKVIEIGKLYTAHERAERLLIVAVSGDGQRTYRTAVEGMVHGDDLMVIGAIPHVCIFPGSLDRTLYRLCTRIGEKHLAHAGVPDDLHSSIPERFVIVEIGSVKQFVDLRLQRFVVCRIAVSERIDSDACAKIQILFAIRVIQADSFTMIKDHRKTVISMKDHLFGLVHDLL